MSRFGNRELLPHEVMMPAPMTQQENRKFRKTVVELEALFNEINGVSTRNPFPLTHAFAEGVYMRQVIVPSGNFIIGEIHKDSFVSFLLSGIISIVTEDGYKVRCAPETVIVPPMTKRFAYAHTDVVWTTIHPNLDNTEDINLIESRILAEKYDGIPSVDEAQVSNRTKRVFRGMKKFIEQVDYQFRNEIKAIQDVNAQFRQKQVEALSCQQ